MTDGGAVRARIEELLIACIEAAAVDGGGMSLVTPNGDREPLYGSDQRAESMESLQLTLGEGPCVDASASGSPVLVPDLRDPGSGVWSRWPTFLSEASQLEVRAVFALPVRIGAIALGAIDLYRLSAGPLGREGLAKAVATADAIAYSLLDTEGVIDAGISTELVNDLVVHRAAGMIMVQLDTTIEEALVRLRAASYAERVPIGELANQVVNGSRRFEKEHG